MSLLKVDGQKHRLFLFKACETAYQDILFLFFVFSVAKQKAESRRSMQTTS